MKVTELELFAVPPRWLFLKLSTDEGIAGWGEPIVEGRATTVRAAVEELGELIVGRDPFRIEDHSRRCGAAASVRKIAAMAEAFDVAVAPHCPLGPIALAASLQLDACTPNAVIQETSLKMHYNESADLLDYVRDASVFEVRDGHMAVPDGPGLGVEIAEERVREAAWHSPVWRNQDGTVAEW